MYLVFWFMLVTLLFRILVCLIVFSHDFQNDFLLDSLWIIIVFMALRIFFSKKSNVFNSFSSTFYLSEQVGSFGVLIDIWFIQKKENFKFLGFESSEKYLFSLDFFFTILGSNFTRKLHNPFLASRF